MNLWSKDMIQVESKDGSTLMEPSESADAVVAAVRSACQKLNELALNALDRLQHYNPSYLEVTR